jgi:hypothetical protein
LIIKTLLSYLSATSLTLSRTEQNPIFEPVGKHTLPREVTVSAF